MVEEVHSVHLLVSICFCSLHALQVLVGQAPELGKLLGSEQIIQKVRWKSQHGLGCQRELILTICLQEGGSSFLSWEIYE
jgi:hypothetical protein